MSSGGNDTSERKTASAANSPKTCGLKNFFVVKPKEVARDQVRKEKAVFALNYRLPFDG